MFDFHPFIMSRYKVPLFLGVKISFWLRELTGIPKVYSDESDNKKIIFIHIPKAAGSSIGNALFGTDIIGHYPYYIYRNYNRKKFNEYYKFCVVRNPYSRVESAYNYLVKGGKGAADKKIGKYIQENSSSFSDFCENLLDKNFANKNVHFTPQSDFIFSDKKLMVDKIVKLENLVKDIKDVENYLGRALHIPVNNKVDKVDSVLTLKAREKIKILYERDFELLGYE